MICVLAAVAIAAHPPADTTKKTDYSAPPGAPYTAENVTVPTKAGHTLAGTLTLPKGASRTLPVGAIVTITGTGPQDRDEFLGLAGYRPFRQIADSLGRRGIAVLRMDDRGVGESKGTFKSATDEDFANDIRAGLAYLRTRPEIDVTRLGLLGHSEGALIAAMVAPGEPNLRAVVMLAGASGSLRHIAIDQLSNGITHNAKLSAAQKDSALHHVPLLVDSMGIDPWWHFLITHDFSTDERQIRTPAVLILTGANDQQANPKEVAEIAANVKAAGNRDVTADVVPGVDHLFVVDSDGFPGHYKDLPTPAQVQPKVIGTVVDWLVARLVAQSADFDAYVAAGVRDWHVPGLGVAVVEGDSVVFQKAYGVRDVTTNAPFDIHTRSAIGSTTKAMTVVALGMLVDEGKVRWDDRVIDHLPDFRLYDEYVTRDLRIRDLLTHRSGLGGEGDLLWANPDMPEPEIVRRMRFLKPESPMRTRFIYNNIMYQVAGDIVEQASGMSWERFLTERIFTPLGMRETIATVAATAGQPNVATPHELVHDTLRAITEVSTDQVKAAGSVYSSIADMTRWVQFLLDSGRVGGRRLISDSVFREIFTPQFMADRRLYPALTLSQPHFFTYGFGMFIQDYAGYKLEMHTGSIDGMCALIALVPEKRLGFYVLENVDHAELRHALMYKAVDTWLGTGTRDWSSELHTLLATAHEKKPAAPAPKAPPSLSLDQYAGTYRDSTFGEIIVSKRGDTLHLQYFSSSATMEHSDHDVFKLTHGTRRYMSDEAATFLPDGTGGVTAVHVFGVTFGRSPLTGTDVVRRMHDRYQSTWYSTLSFTELAEQRQPDGTIKKETWWEEGKLPGRLRIDVGTTPTDTVHGHRTVVFANDSAYVRAPGQAPRAVARLNLLLVLGFDVYRQPVERTVAELTAEGFDLSRVHTDTWHGRPAVVVGALAGDTTSSQFWIDSERDVFLRLHQGDLDAWFDDYRPLDGGWIATDVTIMTKGVTTLHEVYAHIKGNVQLPDAWFDGRALLNDPGSVH